MNFAMVQMSVSRLVGCCFLIFMSQMHSSSLLVFDSLPVENEKFKTSKNCRSALAILELLVFYFLPDQAAFIL